MKFVMILYWYLTLKNVQNWFATVYSFTKAWNKSTLTMTAILDSDCSLNNNEQ